ncbi:MAG TPA: hypothetical protein VMV29_09570 [Ktedonobacterales bacterium]|nr:hypothetical protein [Ktedonobacterales bacterium]
MFFLSGIAAQLSALIAVSLSILAISAIAHSAQVRRRLRPPAPTRAQRGARLCRTVGLGTGA